MNPSLTMESYTICIHCSIRIFLVIINELPLIINLIISPNYLCMSQNFQDKKFNSLIFSLLIILKFVHLTNFKAIKLFLSPKISLVTDFLLRNAQLFLLLSELNLISKFSLDKLTLSSFVTFLLNFVINLSHNYTIINNHLQVTLFL